MGVHYQAGGMIPGTGQREPHPDELPYLREETRRLNDLVATLTIEKREAIDQLSAFKVQVKAKVHRDLELRRLRYDNMHLWSRNLELMHKLSRLQKTPLEEVSHDNQSQG